MLLTGKFDDYKNHHDGWFRVFRFEGQKFEIWFGSRWFMIG